MSKNKSSTTDVARVCKKIGVAIKGEDPLVSANALLAMLEMLAKLEKKVDQP